MFHRLNARVLFVFICCAAPVGHAQEDDVFGGGDPPGALAPAAGADRPILGEKPDLVIESIREANPSTPEALTRAVQTLLDYGAPKEAKLYLDKLIATKPEQGVLLDLHRKFGSAFFMQLGRDQRMAPDGARLSNAVLDTARAAARDPVRLQSLLEQLRDPSEPVRRAALVDLHDAGERALVPLLNALADEKLAADHALLADAILELNEIAIEPLVGALESPDEAFRARAIELLGRLRSRLAVPRIVGAYLSPKSGPALKQEARIALVRIIGDSPTRYDAEQYLYRRATSHLKGEAPRKPSYLGYVDLWHWDEGQRVPVLRRYLAQDAALVVAAQLAADLYQISPEKPDVRRLYLTAGLELQKMLGGMDQPLPKGPGTLHAAAASAGIEAIEDLLLHAIKENYVAAAAGACEVLADIATPSVLASRGVIFSPLTQALRHADRRLRFAATLAVLKLDPRESYPGSSYVTETLGLAVATTGARRALVVHPQAAAAQNVIGFLNEIGFEADSAATGKRGFQMAAEGTDYEFVLISDAVDNPDTNELLQQLRRDPRTARLPVGLMFRSETEGRMRRLAEDDLLAQAMPRPHSRETAGFEVSRLLGRAGRNLLAPAERMNQAVAALDRLKPLVERADLYPFYDLLRLQPALELALGVPDLSAKAAEVLGLLGSPAAQRALAGAASQNARPLAERQAAAAAFAEAIQRRGILLTTSEIRNQYEVYNKSETLDPETQAVLASLLDAIEARANLNAPPAAEKQE